jgi:hypothetical protein
MRFYNIGFSISIKKLNKSISYHNNQSSISIKANIRSIRFAFFRHLRESTHFLTAGRRDTTANFMPVGRDTQLRPTACSRALVRYDARRRRTLAVRARARGSPCGGIGRRA